jgi:hypothetical protein
LLALPTPLSTWRPERLHSVSDPLHCIFISPSACLIYKDVFYELVRSFQSIGVLETPQQPAGRIFRLVAGAGFLVVGFVYRHHALGMLSLAWSALPLSAGALDVCYISALLGGPLSGAKIRSMYKAG